MLGGGTARSGKPLRVLVTGATGVLGQEVTAQLAEALPDATVTGLARRLAGSAEVAWNIGAEPVPASLRGHWDVVVHTAASTRWNQTVPEAETANIRPMISLLEILDRDTHLVHVSTAFAAGAYPEEEREPSELGHFRNAYEWSKARCEELAVERHRGATSIIRPPLIMGSSADGAVGRFTGPYTLLQSLVSGLAPVVVGDQDGYAEIAPVDEVAAAVVKAVAGAPPPEPVMEIVAGGAACLQLGELIGIFYATLNEWRLERNLSPVTEPPFIGRRRWHRFFLPLARQHLSPVQLQVIELLGAFETYTSLPKPLDPTWEVNDPGAAFAKSVRWWADRKPRLASRTPQPWQLHP